MHSIFNLRLTEFCFLIIKVLTVWAANTSYRLPWQCVSEQLNIYTYIQERSKNSGTLSAKCLFFYSISCSTSMADVCWVGDSSFLTAFLLQIVASSSASDICKEHEKVVRKQPWPCNNCRGEKHLTSTTLNPLIYIVRGY